MKVALSVHGTNPGSRARLREIVHELARPIERRLGSLQPDTARIEESSTPCEGQRRMPLPVPVLIVEGFEYGFLQAMPAGTPVERLPGGDFTMYR